jgi:hypothetical protein
MRTALVVAVALTLTACGANGTEEGHQPTPSPDTTALEWRDTGQPPAGPDADGQETLADGTWRVSVTHAAEAKRPSRVIVEDVASGETRRLRSPRPASGGSWSLHDGVLRYPTWGPDGAWCLATVTLDDLTGDTTWCAGKGEGWSGLTASDHGVGVMTFDDTRPVACRTVNLLDPSGRPEPVEGPTPCVAWDVAAVDGGVVWSEVPKPRQQESATFHGRTDGNVIDLGPGQTGSLVPCGDSVFWTLDPQAADDPARLMRWRPGQEVEPAYESEARGNVFLGEPACEAGVLTVAAFSETGDVEVSAEIPAG